jgi:hypothetical protein
VEGKTKDPREGLKYKVVSSTQAKFYVHTKREKIYGYALNTQETLQLGTTVLGTTFGYHLPLTKC